MANLAEQTNWDDSIYQLEETDDVIGGPNGISNLQAKQLADRTQWLKNALKGFVDFTFVNANTVLALADVLQKLVVVNANFASIACILPILTADEAGTIVSIMAYNVSKQVSVISQGNNDIVFTKTSKQVLYLSDGESIQLVWAGDHWLLYNWQGNFLTVGKPDFCYSVIPNTVIANGQLLKRNEYPRLWEYVQTIAGLVTDFNWTNIANNKGFFSTGDGATTFRVPDLRSMFIRGLDLGANIDFGRIVEQPGGYEADDLKSHTHSYDDDAPGSYLDFGSGSSRQSWTATQNKPKSTGYTGGLETRPKNIGLIPLIYV